MTYRENWVSFLLLILFFSAVWGQTNLQGTVVDSFDTPVPNAEVYLKSTGQKQITGSDGSFIFQAKSSSISPPPAYHSTTATVRVHSRGLMEINIERQQSVRVDVFDLGGKKIATIHNGILDAGNHRMRFPRTIAKQMMLIRARIGSAEKIGKVVPGQELQTFTVTNEFEPRLGKRNQSAADQVTVKHYEFDDAVVPVADYEEIVPVRLTRKKLNTRLINKMRIGDTLWNSSNQLRLVLDSVSDQRCCCDCECDSPGFFQAHFSFFSDSILTSVQLHSTRQREIVLDEYRISLQGILPECPSTNDENYKIGVACLPVDSPHSYENLSFEFFETNQPGERKLRKHDDTFDIADFETAADWEKRKNYLRRHILFASGLWPETGFVPLESTILDAYEGDGFIIKKVFMPIWEGYYLTGNLYLPTEQKEKHPAMLAPHGHWVDGRLQNSSQVSVPGRCIHYAKQGYIVFSYDMPGNVDSRQVDHFFTRSGSWGCYSNPVDDIWGISNGSLLMAHSMRAMDFLYSFDRVDTSRIGVTGASGGATQTVFLSAVDDRIDALAPVSHISAHEQDGCGCGNAPLLRLNTNNVEIAATASDKPICLVGSQNDWSCNTMTVEYPMIRKIYQLYGQTDLVQATVFNFGHNYNQTSREYVYNWFRTRFLPDQSLEYKEDSVTIPSKEVMSVWSEHSQPSDALDESGVRAMFKRKAQDEFGQLFHAGDMELETSIEKYRKVWNHVISSPPSEKTELVDCLDEYSIPSRNLDVEKIAVGNKTEGNILEAVLFKPQKNASSEGLLVVNGQNTSMLKTFFNRENTVIHDALSRGATVMLIDKLQYDHYNFYSRKVKEFKTEGIVKGTDFFTSYNRTDEALCVQTISDALSYLNNRTGIDESSLYCTGNAGVLGLVTSTVNENISSAVLDLNHFNPESDDDYLQSLYIPHIKRAGGIEGALCVSHAENIMLYNNESSFPEGRIQTFISEKRGGTLAVENTFSTTAVSDFLFED